MVYGDLQFIDLIIFAGVAAFLVYRLRNVLGKRTGFQKKNLSEGSDFVEDIKVNPKNTLPS